MLISGSRDYRILPTVPAREWREPSCAQPKDQFGNQNRTRFRLTARLNDGAIRWRGWFDSREDADAFLWALCRYEIEQIPVPRELWQLPVPAWQPDIGPHVSYDFASLTFLTSGTGSTQSWTSSSDWNSLNNSVECLAGGGSGGFRSASLGTPATATGGGGSEWRRITNFVISSPGTTTITYEIGAGGVAVGGGGSGGSLGNAGAATWFNGATKGAASVWAEPGAAGSFSGGSGARSGGAGGTGGAGTSSHVGGRGGNISGNTGSYVASGGGAAAAAANTGDSAGDWGINLTAHTAGGTAVDTGGDPIDPSGFGSGADGANGREWQFGSAVDGLDYGSGGGGGGTARGGTSDSGGRGGAYGAGGGGCVAVGGQSGGGSQGIVALTNTPALTSKYGLLVLF